MAGHYGTRTSGSEKQLALIEHALRTWSTWLINIHLIGASKFRSDCVPRMPSGDAIVYPLLIHSHPGTHITVENYRNNREWRFKSVSCFRVVGLGVLFGGL